MTFDPVPWMVGGGAEHSPEVARLLAYAAFRGAEGVVGSGDLKVTPLATPGASVRVAPGACAIVNRSGTYQSYAGRLVTEDVLPIAATGGATRSDLIVARVEDPFAPGTSWGAPADPRTGPYIFTRVIAGVPAGTTSVEALGLGQSAIALARIDLPANTSVVNAGNIVDLRQAVAPRRERRSLSVYPSSTRTVSANTFADFGGSATVAIPAWATRVVVRGDVTGAVLNTATATGAVKFTMVANGVTLETQETGVEQIYNGGRVRWGAAVGAALDIPAAMRGRTATINILARRGTGTGTFSTDTYSTILHDLEFLEVPV